MSNVDPNLVPPGMETASPTYTPRPYVNHDESPFRIPGWVGFIVGALLILAAQRIPVWTAPAKAVISIVPAQRSPDSAVAYSAADSTAEGYEWTPPPNVPFAITDKGQRITLNLPPNQKLPLGLTVRSASGGRLTSDTISIEVSAEDKPDDPKPPGPKPPPKPDIPDGKYKLAAWIKGEVETKLSGRATSAAEAKAVGEVFEAVASQIAAGALSGPGAIASETLERVDKTLGEARGPWEPVIAAFEDHLPSVILRGATDSDIAEAWRETALGLGAVK